MKELGYLNYSKPDVHLIDVFSQLGLSAKNPVAVFESIVEMAEVCKTVDSKSSPYKLDKIIWLICSGRFYLDDIAEKKGALNGGQCGFYMRKYVEIYRMVVMQQIKMWNTSMADELKEAMIDYNQKFPKIRIRKKRTIDNRTNVRYNNSRFATWGYFYFVKQADQYLSRYWRCE